jgi:serine/threonine protein kinase
MTTTNLGTPLTMAPEILDSQSYTANVDLWSLGCVLYKLLFGKDPFMASSRPELRKKIEKNNGPNLLFPPGTKISEPVFLSF